MKRVAAVVLSLTLFASSALAMAANAAQRVPEFAMKAVYLYNFAQLTNWPPRGEASDEPFNLCVFGGDEVFHALEALEGRKVNGHPLHSLQIEDAVAVRQCHLLFLGEDAGRRGRRLLDGLGDAPILTVTDDPSLADSVAVSLVVTEGKRLAFDIKLGLAKGRNLALSSKLLRLANRVIVE